MASTAKRSIVVDRVTAELNEQVVAIVADHIRAQHLVASSFDALLAETRQTFPGLPSGVLDAACAKLNSAANFAWTESLLRRILDCGDVRVAMMQPTSAAADLPRRPSDGSLRS